MVLPFGDWRIPALHVLQRGELFYEGGEKKLRMENYELRKGRAQEGAKWKEFEEGWDPCQKRDLFGRGLPPGRLPMTGPE
jgi:hypothetical protein